MMNAVRMGGRKVSFTMKSCVCAATWIPGRDLLFTCSEYIRISLCNLPCSLLTHVHRCCWNGLAGFSQYYIKILHVFTPVKKIYIYYTHQLWWNILDRRAVLSKYNKLLVKGQVFNGNVGHFRILRRCYKQCIMLAIYWLFSQTNSNITPIQTMHYNLKHVTSRRFIV